MSEKSRHLSESPEQMSEKESFVRFNPTVVRKSACLVLIRKVDVQHSISFVRNVL